jgi:KUP system potassium uptake protein
MQSERSGRRYFITMALSALGVVYGDIGTSPLYAFRECFFGPHGINPTPDNVLGVLSLIFWSLVLIVSVKYLTLVMRADNNGEGGILALMALAFPDRPDNRRAGFRMMLVITGVFGAALLYGDGMITPAISVLSAVEGLEIATPMFTPFVIPITILVIVMLFSFQHIGTGKVGKIFGPVTLVWFAVIAALGIAGILRQPQVLASINPMHGVQFFTENGYTGFVVLGAVFLVVTGGEALYADMGHFGRKPIRCAWFSIVFPALLLNYMGQGALLLESPEAAVNPFYNLAPSWSLYPLVVLATLATVIASQALISGTFSITMQAIQLGYCPRLRIDHTSSLEKGQVYLPLVNWTLMCACIGLVLGFGSSSRLAAAYGIAVTLTMIITTVLFYFAAREVWRWSIPAAVLTCLPFLLIELAFFGANLIKIAHGGWFPLVIGVLMFTFMSTWKTGRKILRERLAASVIPFDDFMKIVVGNPPLRVRGTAIFMAGNPDGTPVALLHNLKHNKVLHERVVLLTIVTGHAPRIARDRRLTIEKHEHGFVRVIGNYGFMEEPNVSELLEECKEHGLEFRPLETTFFLSRETIIPTNKPGMAIWREHLFTIMSRNSQSATAYFRLPANRVVELGMQVEL